jgi:PAS domain S-box-containing protein
MTEPRWATQPAIAATLVTIVVGAALAVFSTVRLSSNDSRIAHTYDVKSALADVLTSVTDAETGQRGFVITGDTSYLQPYTDGTAQTRRTLSSLDALTRDDAAQQASLSQLREEIARKSQELARTIQLRRDGGFEAAQQLVRTNVGQSTMARVRTMVAEMSRHEDALLEIRNHAAAVSLRIAIALELATAFMALMLVGVAALVSRRRLIEAEARGTLARRLAAIVESSDDAIIGKDLTSTVTSWNQCAERIFGYSAAEMIGQSIRRIIPPDRQREEDHVLDSLRRGESVAHFETVRVRKDGTLIPVSLTISPIRDEAGTVVGASKIARDITERQHAEAAVVDLRQRLLALVGGSGALLESPRVDDVLPATIKIAHDLVAADGYSVWRLDLGGDRWRIVSSNGLSQAFVDQIAVSCLHHGGVSTVPFSEPLVVEDLQDAPLRDDRRATYRAEGIHAMLAVPLMVRGEPTGRLVFYYRERHLFSDVEMQTAKALGNLAATALTTAELYDELSRATADAERANRLKDEFLATLSHELRTPLNAILGYVCMLRTGTLEPDRQSRALEVVERNVTSLSRIVEDVLDVSRIITGKTRLDVQPVDLVPVIDHAVATVRPTAEAKGVTLQAVLDRQAPRISGDPDRLQQVIWNLLANAVKFTGRGGRVQIQLARVDSHIEMVVSDTGIGIAPEFLPHVFDRFRQADSGFSRQHGGLGLGLAICRHLIELHGGLIYATSDGEGLGASFRVELPMMIVQADRVFEAPPGRPPADRLTIDRTPGRLNGINVYAVDDESDGLTLLREILEQAGAHVTILASAGEALAAIQATVPDALITDIGMPEMDGFELIRQIRQSPDRAIRDIPAAALTAYARSEDRTRALRSGFQMHLSKPIDPSELVAAVEALVRRGEMSPSQRVDQAPSR